MISLTSLKTPASFLNMKMVKISMNKIAEKLATRSSLFELVIVPVAVLYTTNAWIFNITVHLFHIDLVTGSNNESSICVLNDTFI